MDAGRIEIALDRVRAAARALGDVEVDSGLAKPPVHMDSKVMAVIEQACKDAGVKYRHMPSGAGHDAMCVAKIVPVGMIFVPSRGGISHSGDEFTSWDQVRKGVEVLTRSILGLDVSDWPL